MTSGVVQVKPYLQRNNWDPKGALSVAPWQEELAFRAFCMLAINGTAEFSKQSQSVPKVELVVSTEFKFSVPSASPSGTRSILKLAFGAKCKLHFLRFKAPDADSQRATGAHPMIALASLEERDTQGWFLSDADLKGFEAP